jgi:predicted alpha/beta-hydrolase family hydrolase
MRHPFMKTVSERLFARRIGTLRYQFPYMEKRSGRPDAKPVLHATVRAAVAEARSHAHGIPLLAGGKSMGGRMTSQAESAEPLGVAGLLFFGFPLHPAGKPSTERGDHLSGVKVPMLFLQGTRDALADPALIERTTRGLGPLATVHIVDGADHSFHVLKSSGRTDELVLEEIADAASSFATAVSGA